MKYSSKMALDIQECDYSTFSLGKFSVWLLSLFCLFCIKIRPKKTGKDNTKSTTFPYFFTSFLSMVLGLKPTILNIYKKLNTDISVLNSDSYLSFPSEGNIVEWHRDGAFQLNTESIKLKTGSRTIKFFIYLDPTPFRRKKTEGGLYGLVKKISNIQVDSYKIKSDEIGGKFSPKGALSLIPCTSQITRAVNNAIFNEFIPFDRDHTLGDIAARVQDILDEMDRRNLQSFFGLNREKYVSFISMANNTLSLGSGFSNFFTTFQVVPGKVVVFDDKAIHRGGATIDSKRLVLRVIVSGNRLEDTLLTTQ
jgi:hypothetical protein